MAAAAAAIVPLVSCIFGEEGIYQRLRAVDWNDIRITEIPININSVKIRLNCVSFLETAFVDIHALRSESLINLAVGIAIVTFLV